MERYQSIAIVKIVLPWARWCTLSEVS